MECKKLNTTKMYIDYRGWVVLLYSTGFHRKPLSIFYIRIFSRKELQNKLYYKHLQEEKRYNRVKFQRVD